MNGELKLNKKFLLLKQQSFSIAYVKLKNNSNISNIFNGMVVFYV